MVVTDSNRTKIQQRLWVVEQEILDEIHRICIENGLRYSLAYGTLLGAVRHKGFIPWDDDIDVFMPREDYERFAEIWNQVSREGFLLQTEESSEDYNNTFAKVRKDHTAFIMYEEQIRKSFHKGIFVDIFPMIRQAPKSNSQVNQFAACVVSLLFNRGHASGRKGLMGIAEQILLFITPKKKYRKISLMAGKRARKWQENTSGKWISPCTFVDCRRLYPADLFDRLIDIEFHGKYYHAFADYDRFLTIRYGNYMQLPPEEERVWKHHPIIIDFEHNYEDL